MRILFATDGSQGSEIALDLLLSMPLRAWDRIDVVSVPQHHYAGIAADGTGAFLAEIVETEIEEARRIAAETMARIHGRGVATQMRVPEGPTAEAILGTAADLRSDLIVLGSRGRGMLAGTLLGSTARALTRRSPVPILVVRERREAPRRVLVATDGSPDSRAAIATLAVLPLPARAEITLLHVQPASPLPAGAPGGELRASAEQRERNEALETLRVARALLPAGVTVRLELERGEVAERVISFAGGMGADLVVLGSRGTTPGQGFLQGSTADRVLSEAHCAVLVARVPSPRPMREAEVLAATSG